MSVSPTVVLALAVTAGACVGEIGSSSDGAVEPTPIDASTNDAAPGAADASVADASATADATTSTSLCPDPLPASWIFCDDFEQGDVTSRYFEYWDNDGDFRRVTSESASGDYSMEVLWQVDEVEAGNLKVTFGRNPLGSIYQSSQDFADIYWRMRVKHQPGWGGSPAKLSRATAFSGADWSQAMIAHLWSSGEILKGDPASCVAAGAVACSGYNDFDNLDWLGQLPGVTPIFSTADSGQWRCVEGHARLNTPGLANGVFEFWIDDEVEASTSDLDWRGSWTDYGINAVFFENHWNDGSPVEQRRWFDDLAIATTRIGCD